MASYSYKCNECEKEFEIIHGMNEVIDEIICKCGSKNVKRIYSVPSFKINMTGFCGTINK